jgi:hypothetical protein
LHHTGLGGGRIPGVPGQVPVNAGAAAGVNVSARSAGARTNDVKPATPGVGSAGREGAVAACEAGWLRTWPKLKGGQAAQGPANSESVTWRTRAWPPTVTSSGTQPRNGGRVKAKPWA